MDRVSHFWLMKELSIRMCVCVGGGICLVNLWCVLEKRIKG